ncbi:MAG: VanZ family protein [Acidobacteria bacterium]|nr:VanZ family protein [Acidobacteriota bacterium]
MKNWFYRWGPAILFMAIIFIVSSTPGSDIPGLGAWDFIAKKGGHLIGYALLGAAYRHALNYGNRARKRHHIPAMCMTALYAASDEWHQTFTPGRSGSFSDVGIDIAGGIIGILVSGWAQKHFAEQNKARSVYSD